MDLDYSESTMIFNDSDFEEVWDEIEMIEHCEKIEKSQMFDSEYDVQLYDLCVLVEKTKGQSLQPLISTSSTSYPIQIELGNMVKRSIELEDGNKDVKRTRVEEPSTSTDTAKVLCNICNNSKDGIQTYIFLDLETTGLPKEQKNMTKITEISLVAVKRQHLLDESIGCSPRVQHKLTLCVNPRKIIDPFATKVTGLCNDLLEFEPTFDKNLINLLNMFIDSFTKPVCLIAHNGLCFDFPILRNHLEKFEVGFADNVACADCFHGFYDILESRKTNKIEDPTFVNTNDIQKESNDDIEIYSNNTLDMNLRNERTPTRSTDLTPVIPKKRKHVKLSGVRRRFPWSEGEKPKEKYTLKDIYERLLNRPAQNAHKAENDCFLAIECATVLSKEFVKWVDENNSLFSEIQPMTIGVPLGL